MLKSKKQRIMGDLNAEKKGKDRKEKNHEFPF